jgi:hypothetical protein
MENPISFDETVSTKIGFTTNQPWVAANPPPSSFGDYPAHPRAGYFFQSFGLLLFGTLRA